MARRSRAGFGSVYAGERTRTSKGREPHRDLNPARLPIPPRPRRFGRVPPADQGYMLRAHICGSYLIPPPDLVTQPSATATVTNFGSTPGTGCGTVFCSTTIR